jgi:2-dehydropantoate 2-reductase
MSPVGTSLPFAAWRGETMKILVMGTGGIGGYFGGRLAAAGQDVTFVARGAHLEAIRRDGLQVLSANGNVTVKPAKAVSDPAAAEPPEIIMFATKLGDTEQAARALKPVAREGATIISLQNGIEGPDIIAAALPGAHIVPGLARISCHVARPGVIEHKAQAGRIEFGELDGRRASPRLEAFHRACKEVGIDAVLATEIRYNVWMKFASLAPSSGLITLTNTSFGPVRETPGTRALLADALREVIAVGTAAGVPFKPEDFATIMKGWDSNPPSMVTSMLVDRRAGKPLEINYFSGTVVRMGEKFGVPTPTHKFIAQALSIDADGCKA